MKAAAAEPPGQWAEIELGWAAEVDGTIGPFTDERMSDATVVRRTTRRTMASRRLTTAQIAFVLLSPGEPNRTSLQVARGLPPAARVATQPYPSHQNRPSGVNRLLLGASMFRDILSLMVAAPSRGGIAVGVAIG
ncbi:MAG: hypothetical protein ABSA40_10580 [Candidatus Dormibacteria bacterium]